ncbi:MAG: MoxR family ATPase [Lachnospiraceae bacterium]|nr:MoxR family ATPase [Lachnospiraceae bacterium]
MQRVKQEIKKAVKGKDEVIEKVLAAMLAGGHILLEDIPGVGKTTLAMAIAKTMSLSYKRVQFTPDVLPSDIVGFSMYNQDNKTFEYQQGAVCCNLFLADEINRTSPKTQSALLEVMEEGNVTVDGVTRSLPDPFVVIATENPLGSSGTQMLPESQLDRFMVCLTMGYPEHDAAIDILKDNAKKPISTLESVITAEEFMTLRKKTNDMFVHDSIYEYIVTLVEGTRTNPLFSMGASPRGTIALLRMAKAIAVLNDREYVTPEDIRKVFADVLGHRVKLSTKARAEGKNVTDALSELFSGVNVPRT